jgi:serine/threonine-protein kinase
MLAIEEMSHEPTRLAPDSRVGGRFGEYEIDSLVATGGMGKVYRATAPDGTRVALKLVKDDLARDETFRRRFRREARIAQTVRNPHVVRVRDTGEHDGVPYLAAELIEGMSLEQKLDSERRLDLATTVRICAQVADGLNALWTAGMVHRDVKPGNILLDPTGKAYLTDFGLAKPAASGDGLTRHGTVVARAEYVAPEQLMNERVDARADVYALGCLLFEALTGEPPFGSPGAPLPSPAELAPGVPREFDDVIRQAMAKDPEDRYPSAGDLGEAALVAAGGLRRAKAWSMVATGEASFVFDVRRSASRERPVATAPEESPGEAPVTVTNDPVRWAIALVALLIVAVGMVAALHGISTLK